MYDTNSQIVGKNIITYTPKGNKKYSEEDIRQYLRKFELCSALRLIGEISYKIFNSPQKQIMNIKGVPVFDGVLAYIAMNLIESSNDYRSKDFSKNIDLEQTFKELFQLNLEEMLLGF